MIEKTDLLIIGLGPAGLTAGLYAARYKLNFLLVGKEIGGTMSLASNICNYPGFSQIAGLELAQKIENQIKELGGKIIYDEIIKLKKEKEGFLAISSSQKQYFAKSLILATGTRRRKLQVPGEEELIGKGVSYCATCDAFFFKEKKVAVVGGGNSAVTAALHLSQIAQKVYLIYRGQTLKAEPILIEQIKTNNKIEVIYQTNIVEIFKKPDQKIVGGVKLDKPYRGVDYILVDGVFIEIGGIPSSVLAQEIGILLDEKGFIKVDNEMKTNIAGVFAAGDVTSYSTDFAQIVWACGQGAKAAASAYYFLQKTKAPKIIGL
ncbi:MAG: FAD-dependent oxidoreductase [Candidatus Anstonellaceae archaeon]